jgi:hypothetical protein
MNPPSGKWIGHYTYEGHEKQFPMGLILLFSSEMIHGAGVDAVGPFEIKGTYEANGQTTWTKTYPGLPKVVYKGTITPDGIQGSWLLPDCKGKFFIKPSPDEPEAISAQE